MKKRGYILILFAVAITLAVSAFAYTNILNGSGTMLNLIKKIDFAYVTPKSYLNLIQKLQKKPYNNSNRIKQTDRIISEKSDAFIQAAFRQDSEVIERMLDSSAKYIKSQDGSGFIRFIGNDTHVEGYMATDKKLIKTKQRWHVIEDDETVTSSMEVYIENIKSPQLWYLHFKRVKDDWKLFMLENDV